MPDEFAIGGDLSVPAPGSDLGAAPPEIDLAAFSDVLGNPEDYFLHAHPGAEPVVVLHATGEPKFAYRDGKLEPIPPRGTVNIDSEAGR